MRTKNKKLSPLLMILIVDSSNISSDYLAKKLAFKKAGPFSIIKKVEALIYKL